MKYETFDAEGATEQKPLEPHEEALLTVLEAYRAGTCPQGHHARGKHPVFGAFCSTQCASNFEHEFRVKHSTPENVLQERNSTFCEGSLNTYSLDDSGYLHALRTRKEVSTVRV
ncbi:MAG: hypothetical protein KBD24_03545 [Candidatus Pacebacteria bacterium]|nr:hypothetical protein [Candidatus Paceibacterota bacterium]